MSTEPNIEDSSASHARSLVGDRYQLQDVLGRGGMGQVWRGWDTVLGRPVAVKVVHRHLVDSAAAERFVREARSAARLSDAHIVAVYDAGTDHDMPYLVMQLLQGVSLDRQLYGADPLAPVRAVGLAAQVAAGLACAHSHGIVHRDIKPSNLLVSPQDHVTIADFGLACSVQGTSALTATGQVSGTAAYLAPERALGRPATTASDVYALGCLLYLLLAGEVPFHADMPAALLYQHVHVEPLPPHQRNARVPADLSQFVLRLLAKSPDQRPTADQAHQWLLDWSDADAEQPARTRLLSLSAPAGGSSETRGRGPARRRLTVAATGLGALAAATATALSLTAAHTPTPPTPVPRPTASSTPAGRPATPAAVRAPSPSKQAAAVHSHAASATAPPHPPGAAHPAAAPAHPPAKSVPGPPAHAKKPKKPK